MKKLAITLCAVVLVATACGGDDDVSVDGSPVAAALADQMMSDDDGAPITSREEAECFAGKTVGSIGEDRLAELGVTASNVGDIEDIAFTDDEINSVVDALGDCIDIEAAMAQEFEDDFAPEDASCLASELGEDTLKEMFALGLSDPEADMTEDFFQTFLDAAATCDLPLG